MNRRAFLQSLGLGLGSTLMPVGALSQELSKTPQRLVIVHTQHGAWNPTWAINPWGYGKDLFWEGDLTSLTPEEFSPSLRPLHGYRNRMLLVEGLALLSAEADQSNLRHEKGMAHSLTGAFSQFVPAVVLGGGPSIDQIIATEIGRPDRWRSLELGVGNSKVNAVYQGPGQMLTAMKDPALLHDRLFGSTGLMDGEAGQSQFQVRSMVIERALEQFNRTKKRVSKANRDVLSLHEELLGELGTRVAGLSDLSCYSVDAPESSGDFEATFQAMLPQMAAALSCDMTRVITLQLGDLPGELIGFSGDVHDQYAHRVHEDPNSAEAMTAYGEVHARQVRDLLDILDAIPEGNGTLLDNTLVAWVGEMGNPAHGFNEWPVALFGGQGLQQGKVVNYPQTIPFYEDSLVPGVDTMGLPHQRLLITLAQSLGVNLSKLPVESLVDVNGGSIDCTGALKELLKT